MNNLAEDVSASLRRHLYAAEHVADLLSALLTICEVGSADAPPDARLVALRGGILFAQQILREDVEQLDHDAAIVQALLAAPPTTH